MAFSNVAQSSPYRYTGQTSWYMGRYVHRPIPADPSDEPMTLEPRHHLRPDILSHELYGTWEYWWVFMSRNPSEINHPLLDMVAGLEIMVPTKTRLDSLD